MICAMDTRQTLYFVTPPGLVGRNRRIVELADEKKSYAEIGRMYKLTGERIRQIVERARKDQK